MPSPEILKMLVEQRARSSAIAFRSLALALVGSLWLSANTTALSLKLSLVDISVPVAYVNFAVALFIFGAAINIMNYFVLNEFVRLTSNKLFRFDNSSALIVPLNGESAWSLACMVQFRFLASGATHKLFGNVSMFLLMLPYVFLLLLAYATVFSTGCDIVLRDGWLTFNSLLTALSFILAVLPIVVLVVISTPFSFRANPSFVRWSFLVPIYRREGLWPPRTGEWVGQNPQ